VRAQEKTNAPSLSHTSPLPPLLPPPQGPHSAAIDSAGNLYFTDSGPFGETSLLDPSGSVFVVTGEANNRILRPLALERLAYPTGIAMGPKESAVFVAEMSANRILRFSQRPAGVWHATVFHQFSGRMGPSALAWDEARGYLYAARFEFPDLAAAAGAGGGSGAPSGVVSVLTAEGVLLRDIPLPGAPEVTGVALTPEGSHLVVTCSDAVYKIQL
jgi:sugar lactone lactonase YvrE